MHLFRSMLHSDLPMGLVERLFGRAGAPAKTSAPLTASAATPPPYLSGSTAPGLSSVWRCINLIADAIADLPWREWTGPEDAPRELPISRLVRRPYALMTRREWTWRVVATEALFNTVHLWYVGGYDSEGVPWSLLPLPPQAITPKSPLDPWGLTQPTAYYVAGREVSADEMTILRRSPFPGMTDVVSGLLTIARTQFQAYLAADAAAARYWIAGGPTQTIIKTEQQIDDITAASIAQRWVDRRSNGNDYPAVMGSGADAKPWGADPTAESAVEARKEINADVGRYFGVPTRLLNAPAGDSETYSNVESDATDLLRYTLRGYMGPIEDAISELLPGDYIGGRRMRFDSHRLTQGDLASRATAYASLVGSKPILTVAEARALGFGLAPDGAPAPEPTPPAIPAAVAAMGGTNG